MISTSVSLMFNDVFVLVQSPGALHHKDVLAKYNGSGSTSSSGSSTAAKTSQAKTQLTSRNGLPGKNNSGLLSEVSSSHQHMQRVFTLNLDV
jgi:hypothetical protein